MYHSLYGMVKCLFCFVAVSFPESDTQGSTAHVIYVWNERRVGTSFYDAVPLCSEFV